MPSYPNSCKHLKNVFQVRKQLIYLIARDYKILLCETVRFGIFEDKSDLLYYILLQYD